MGMIVTILTDIIHFGIYYPLNDFAAERGRDVFRFSAGMAILSLLLKPVSCFFVYQMYRERGGDYNINFGKCHQTKNTGSRPLSVFKSAVMCQRLVMKQFFRCDENTDYQVNWWYSAVD